MLVLPQPTPAAARPARQGGAAVRAPPPRAQLHCPAAVGLATTATALLLALAPLPAAAADAATAPATLEAAPAAALFARNCAGCHAGGGNVIAPGATLFAPDLAAAGLGSPDAVFKLIYGGKGRMPGYGEGCAPKGQCTFGARLPDGDIARLAEYVTARAAAGWKE